jgi:hypothetical protein
LKPILGTQEQIGYALNFWWVLKKDPDPPSSISFSATKLMK